jgi:aspartate aminotransferase
MFRLSHRLDNVSTSASIAMTQAGNELKARGLKVISLSQGEPDFATPAHALEAAHQAALAGQTTYTPQEGTQALKRAVQTKFQRDNGLDYALDEIMVGNGGKQIIFNAMLATLDDGDEVIIPAPYWVSYTEITRLFGGKPVVVDCSENNGFRLRPEDLEAAITPRTRWLVLNFPNNPSGACAGRQDIRAIADVMLRHPHVLILTDDMYEHLRFDEAEFSTIAEVEPRLRDRVLTVNGVSKTYAMTGWRVGFCGGPLPLIKAMARVQSQSTGGISSISQAAAVAALEGPQDYLRERAAVYRERRDLALSILAKAPGLRCRKPEGAFYLFANIAGCLGKVTAAGTRIESDQGFVMALLREQGVAAVHGAAYGMSPFFRISYATSDALLSEGCERIVAFCHDMR